MIVTLTFSNLMGEPLLLRSHAASSQRVEANTSIEVTFELHAPEGGNAEINLLVEPAP